MEKVLYLGFKSSENSENSLLPHGVLSEAMDICDKRNQVRSKIIKKEKEKTVISSCTAYSSLSANTQSNIQIKGKTIYNQIAT